MKTMIRYLIVTAVLTGSQLYGQTDPTPPPVPTQEEPEVLNQGPIHEGFAQPIDLVPQAGIISPEEPPADIIENPAAQRPKGSEYVWIPGYWAWDTERMDYVWISGCWRVPPTGMSWMPGYWNKVPQGWQWVPGFWIPTAQAKQVQYLPQPPEIVQIEPPSSVVITGQIWVPPCYYWRNNTYILRAGYWLTPQDNWVWIPSHYSWTPYGYVFVPGYWDYVLPTRGILYAPVYFPRHFHRPHGYSYSLGVVVNIGNLEFSLFSSPRYCHYYFGDYYSDVYVGLGIYPWFEFHSHHGWYDPIYEHSRCHYRHSIPNWDRHVRHEYDLRRKDPDLRPPRTYRELESRFAQGSHRERDDIRMVESIGTYAERKSAPFKFSPMSDKERQKIVTQTSQVNNFRQERRQRETGSLASSVVQPPRESRETRTTAMERGRSEESKRPDSTIIRPSRETEAAEQITTGRGRPAESKQPTAAAAQPSREVRAAEQITTERSRSVESTQPAPTTTQTSKETRTSEQIATQPKRRVESSAEQTRTAESAQTERAGRRVMSERQVSDNRSSSEKVNYPKSPVTGRSSRGLFRESVPSQSEKEVRIEQRPSPGPESRIEGGGRNRERR